MDATEKAINRILWAGVKACDVGYSTMQRALDPIYWYVFTGRAPLEVYWTLRDLSAYRCKRLARIVLDNQGTYDDTINAMMEYLKITRE